MCCMIVMNRWKLQYLGHVTMGVDHTVDRGQDPPPHYFVKWRGQHFWL